MSNHRIEWVDTLKFLGMFYIYLGHIGPSAGKLYPFVFSFHVPLFFFISGLFYNRSYEIVSSMKIIKRSFIKIIIPYAVFSIIGIAVYAIKWNLPEQRIQEMLLNALMGIRNQVPITSLWFLPALFIVISYYTLFNLLLRNTAVIFIVSLVIYCLTPIWGKQMPSVIFNMDSALHYLCYFSFGVLMSNKVKYEWPMLYETKYRIMILFIIALSFVYFLYAYQYGTFSKFKDIIKPEVRYLIYFFVTCFMFIPSIALSYWININAFKELGRNSLLLCGTEQITKVTLTTIFAMFGINSQFKDPLQALIFTVLCFVFSYFTMLKIYTAFSLRAKSYR
ncbi:TPA: acyltransferase family protein [Escherichia coli]|nr:acyltransferase family protein [Escherichia coli]